MKLLQRSFLAIIGLLVMGFTFAAHEGVLKIGAEKKQVYVCKRNIDARQYTSCITGNTYMRGTSPCPPVGHAGFDCGKNAILAAMDYTCPGGNRFCCARRTTQACAPGCVRVQVFCMQQ